MTHDFTPLSDEDLREIRDLGAPNRGEPERMAREIRAWREKGRALVEANDDHTPAGRLRWEKAAADIRAVVAHVEQEPGR